MAEKPAAGFEISSSRYEDQTVLTRMAGRANGQAVTGGRAEFERSILDGNVRYWLFDLSGLTGFTPDTVPAGAHWWRAFRGLGGTTVLFVTSLPAARMAALSLGFAVGVVIHICQTRREADEKLRALQAG